MQDGADECERAGEPAAAPGAGVVGVTGRLRALVSFVSFVSGLFIFFLFSFFILILFCVESGKRECGWTVLVCEWVASESISR